MKRKQPLRIGLIGFGTIGTPFCRAVRSGAAGRCELSAILVRGKSVQIATAEAGSTCVVTTDPEQFFALSFDLVIEAAGQQAIKEYGHRVLSSGTDLMVLSGGVFADDSLRGDLMAVAIETGARVLIPSGAIVGLDGASAAAVGRIDEAVHITRKPPAAWKGTLAEEQVDLDALQQPHVLYEGSPRESARLYPSNVNVQTAVALAGAGLNGTRVKVVADPTVDRNTHEIHVRGEFGEFRIVLQNVPSPGNPKTGILTALALIKAVRNLTSPLVVGV